MKGARTCQIRELNDDARRTFEGCRVLITKGLQDSSDLATILDRVKHFSDFTPANDPYGEHDFGVIQMADQTIFWKFDYYDLDLTMRSLDPSEPAITTRVLTIMLADEY